ncbi:MAG: class I SAM-dependent methyltransferase [Candidatus Omnitrophica bacterium]|nr:class I SAM-dependent methyltransferase [Candidatus Omnitrophota bacterium]MDD5436305.1 class I SAM-dependent methyltransferase [Candidatus Omnitrophota bacterium]
MKKDYISVIYNEKRTPRTDYPSRLASYLVGRFKIAGGAKLLEIGCGRGDFLEAFRDLGLDCYGTDLSSKGVKNGSSLNIKCADVTKEALPYGDNTFDVVYHKSLLEHLSDPGNLMEETYRVLKPGGRVIILTPDWISQMKVFYEDFTHARPYDKRSLNDLLTIYGFSDVQTELFYQLPALWKYPSLKMVSSTLRAVLSTPGARKLTDLTKIKFFRWSVELMVFGAAVKQR